MRAAGAATCAPPPPPKAYHRPLGARHWGPLQCGLRPRVHRCHAHAGSWGTWSQTLVRRCFVAGRPPMAFGWPLTNIRQPSTRLGGGGGCGRPGGGGGLWILQ